VFQLNLIFSRRQHDDDFETIFSEKLEALISRGALNSRMKDYHDLIIIVRSGELEVEKPRLAIEATFKTRGTELKLPLSFDDRGMAAVQRLWVAHLRGLGAVAGDLKLPGTVSEVLSELNRFLMKSAVA
jgi:hypothetical protein